MLSSFRNDMWIFCPQPSARLGSLLLGVSQQNSETSLGTNLDTRACTLARAQMKSRESPSLISLSYLEYNGSHLRRRGCFLSLDY